MVNLSKAKGKEVNSRSFRLVTSPFQLVDAYLVEYNKHTHRKVLLYWPSFVWSHHVGNKVVLLVLYMAQKCMCTLLFEMT